LSPSDLTLHRLHLKINTTVTLIRNLNISDGFVNGTQMIVKGLHENMKITGSGKIILIPRIQLHPSHPTIPFKAFRQQFPIKIVFAMTINNALGLMLKHAGMHLPSPVFNHGQLYVTFSMRLFICQHCCCNY
jgi:PIF1 helicase.